MAAFIAARKASLLYDWESNPGECDTSLSTCDRTASTIHESNSGLQAPPEGGGAGGQGVPDDKDASLTSPQGGAGEEPLEIVFDVLQLGLGLVLLSLKPGGGVGAQTGGVVARLETCVRAWLGGALNRSLAGNVAE